MRPDLRPELERILDRDQRAGSLRLSGPGTIDRKHYCLLIGLRALRPGTDASGVFDRYESLLAAGGSASEELGREESCERAHRVAVAEPSEVAGGWRSGSHVESVSPPTKALEPDDAATPQSAVRAAPRRDAMRAMLRVLLNADLAVDKIVMSRGGKISRIHYAAKIGLAKTAVSRTVVDIFEEFELALGNPQRLHDLRLPEMRSYLEAEWAAGRLVLRDGRIDRQVFIDQFGFQGGHLLSRYPQVRELFQEFDARVATEGYLPISTRTLMEGLERILADGPPLARNLLSINRKRLAALMGIDRMTFRKNPFRSRLEQADSELQAALEADDTVVLLHGKTCDFRPLSLYWGDSFARSVAGRFQALAKAATKEHSETLKDETLRLFLHVGRFLVARGRSADERISQILWEEGVRDLTSAIRFDASLAPGTKNNRINRINQFAAAYAVAGIVPPLSGRIRGIKNAARLGGRLPGLAEAVPVRDGTEPPDRVSEYTEFAASVLREAATRRSIEIEGEIDAFAASLGQEIAADAGLAELSIPQACLRIIDRRLGALANAAVSVIEEAERLFERGSELIAAASFDADHFRRDYFSAPDKHRRNAVLRAAFPLTGDTEKALGNMLSFADQSFGGLLPSSNPHKAPIGFGQFFPKRYLELGGRPFLDAHLNPATEAVSAALVCYLIESGANIAVGRTQQFDCFRPSELKGHVSLAGPKARARGKLIVVDLEVGSKAVHAISWLKAAIDRRRKRCDEDAKDSLFLVEGPDGTPREITEATFRSAFKRIAERASQLAGLLVNPSMIRPSVLLKVAIENDGRIQAGAIVGQHGTEVSKLYQQRWPVLLMYDQTIRVFQDHFATLAGQMLHSPAGTLGVSTAEWASRLAGMRRTGLGVLCKGVDPRRQTATGACGSLDCWNECPSMVLVAEVETIAELQIWQASLRAAEGDWVRDRIERWERVWLPWLCFCDVVEEKLARGPGLMTWQAAAARKKEIEASPQFRRPEAR